jgi:hypothetical protein
MCVGRKGYRWVISVGIRRALRNTTVQGRRQCQNKAVANEGLSLDNLMAGVHVRRRAATLADGRICGPG